MRVIAANNAASFSERGASSMLMRVRLSNRSDERFVINAPVAIERQPWLAELKRQARLTFFSHGSRHRDRPRIAGSLFLPAVRGAEILSTQQLTATVWAQLPNLQRPRIYSQLKLYPTSTRLIRTADKDKFKPGNEKAQLPFLLNRE